MILLGGQLYGGREKFLSGEVRCLKVVRVHHDGI